MGTRGGGDGDGIFMSDAASRTTRTASFPRIRTITFGPGAAHRNMSQLLCSLEMIISLDCDAQQNIVPPRDILVILM